MNTDMKKATASERRRLLTVLAISRVSERPTSASITGDQVAAELVKLGEDSSSLEGDFLIMSNEYRWLQPLERTLSGESDVTMRQEGVDAAAEVERQLTDKRALRATLRVELLEWLYEQQYDEGVGFPSPHDFVNAGRHYFGRTYTEAEVDQAGGILSDEGLIKGHKASGYASPVRAELTEKGRKLVENGPDQEKSSGVGGDQYNVYAPSNFASHSQNFTQSVDASQQWVNKMSDVVGVAPTWLAAEANNAPEAQEVIRELQAVAEEPQPDASRARQLLTKLGELIQDAGAGALGGLMQSGIREVFDMMPG